MKRVIATATLLALVSNCTYTLNYYAVYEDVQPIIVSERVGETIDPWECTQFDLFHGITYFESATYFEIREGGYVVQIVAAGKRYTAVNRDIHGIEILRDRIDRFEEIQESPGAFESKWKIIDYDDLGQPITYDEMRSVRRENYSCGCAGGSWLIGLIPNILLSFPVIGGYSLDWFGSGEFPRPVAAWVSFILINVGTVATGAIIGKRLDDNAALKAIKQARLPKEIQ